MAGAERETGGGGPNLSSESAEKVTGEDEFEAAWSTEETAASVCKLSSKNAGSVAIRSPSPVLGGIVLKSNSSVADIGNTEEDGGEGGDGRDGKDDGD